MRRTHNTHNNNNHSLSIRMISDHSLRARISWFNLTSSDDSGDIIIIGTNFTANIKREVFIADDELYAIVLDDDVFEEVNTTDDGSNSNSIAAVRGWPNDESYWVVRSTPYNDDIDDDDDGNDDDDDNGKGSQNDE